MLKPEIKPEKFFIECPLNQVMNTYATLEEAIEAASEGASKEHRKYVVLETVKIVEPRKDVEIRDPITVVQPPKQAAL